MRLRDRYACFVLFAALASCAAYSATARADGPAPCSPESVGVDVSLGTDSGALILGMALGQTFVATDTLIRSVTVWRIPSEAANPSGMKFWLTELDSTGTPRTGLVVHEGPTIRVVSQDTSRPTPIQYVFDPPIGLPRPSQYCFWVQVICGSYADLLLDPNDDYPGGHEWRTGRSSFGGCYLRDYPDSFVGFDLAFLIEFCTTAATPARGSTWGELKLRYR